MKNPPKIGTIWTARATLQNRRGETIGSCMDTPNAIAKALMQVSDATCISDASGSMKMRSEYNNRMSAWNTAESHLIKV